MKKATIVAVAVLAASATTATPSKCGMAPTIDFIFRTFQTHPLVLLGEQHRRKEFHEFLQALLQDPRFLRAIDDVVVEFGNGKYQSVIDRYVSGAAVDDGELQRVWRDTTQIVTWDSPVYRDFFRSVRALNARHPHHPVRVLLGDPPIDWSTVRTADDYGRFADRDRFFTNVVEREVLARNHRGLLISGNEHVIRTGKAEPASAHPGAGELLRTERPGTSYAIFTVPPRRPLSGLADCHPVALDTAGDIGAHPFSEMMESGVMVRRIVDGKPRWMPMSSKNSPPLREKADAVIWLGATTTEVAAPADVWTDAAYLAEVRRRAKIMSDFFGLDLTADLPPMKP